MGADDPNFVSWADSSKPTPNRPITLRDEGDEHSGGSPSLVIVARSNEKRAHREESEPATSHSLFEIHREYARRVAISIAQRSFGSGWIEEAIHDAHVGLFYATLRFDRNHRSSVPGLRRARFTTYAFPFIFGAIHDGFRARRPALRTRLPEFGQRDRVELDDALHPPDSQSIVRTSGSIRNGESITCDLATEAQSNDPSILAERRDLYLAAVAEVRRLPRRQRIVLRLLMGRSLGVCAIADLVDIDKSQIARDYQKAIATLRHALSAG